jgi:hypothetical protein
MLAATAIAANFFMMCGLPKMPFRDGIFPNRERRDLEVPRESSTKIIEMAGRGGFVSLYRKNVRWAIIREGDRIAKPGRGKAEAPARTWRPTPAMAP